MSKIIFICHPWRGNSDDFSKTNFPDLTKKVCRHVALNSTDIPFSTGLYLNQFLDDNVENERKLGIKLGHEIMEKCDMVYSYEMNGISSGMEEDLKIAKELGKKVISFKKYPWEK